jgi:steroid delta-isomerase-like uncharacterized protein
MAGRRPLGAAPRALGAAIGTAGERRHDLDSAPPSRSESVMREGTIRLVQAYYDAFNCGDVAGMVALLADDVAHDINQGGREVGREAFRAFMARMARSYRERLRDIVVMATDDGTRAAAEFVVDGTYLATDEGLPEAKGQTYSLAGGAFFEARGGRIARVTNWYNLQDWLRQVRDG